MTNWAAVEAKATGQRGLISREQLMELGVSERSLYRALAAGRLQRVVPSVYRFTVAPETWDLRAQAVLMTARPGDALSHSSAAVLWGLLGFTRSNAPVIHLCRQDRRQLRLGAGYEVHRPTRPFIPYWLSGLPVTRLARTIVDLAPELDERRLEQLLDQAHLRRPCLQRWLTDELAPLDPKRFPGVGMLKQLLAVRRGVTTESPFETDLRRFVRKRKVEEPTLQLVVHDEHGPIMRVDAAWEAHRIALHADSYLWHGDRKTFDDDAAKRRRLVAAGWASVAVTSTDLEDERWFRAIEKLLHDRAPQTSLFGFWSGRSPGAGLCRPAL